MRHRIVSTYKTGNVWNHYWGLLFQSGELYPIKSTILCTRVATSFFSGEAVAKHWSTVASTFNSAVAKGSGDDWLSALPPVSFSAPFFDVPWDWGAPCVDKRDILPSNTDKYTVAQGIQSSSILFYGMSRYNYTIILAFISGEIITIITIAGIHLYSWVERGTVSCPRTQHNVPSQGLNPDRSIRRRAWGHRASSIHVN